MITYCVGKCEGRTTPQIIFTLHLPKRKPVFMSIDADVKNFSIVVVDAQKFLNLWRDDPYITHQQVANGTPETWRKDRKYNDAERGFSKGRDNPVPITKVSYRTFKSEHDEHIQCVALSDGITRTIWLLTNGCEAFPVQCDNSNAHELFAAAGAEGSMVYTPNKLAEVTQPC